jgi:hypothetical protein
LHPHNSGWAASSDELPERMRQKIDGEKCLISILWGLNRIHSLIDIAKGIPYNTALFCEQVVPSLVADITSPGRWKTLKG